MNKSRNCKFLLHHRDELSFRKNASSGFTIVELLIVIVVIAILAAITIVSYSGIQQRARTSVAMNDLRNLQSAVEIYNADTGVLPAVYGSGTAELTELDSVLKSAGLYTATRKANSGDTSHQKSFVFCSNPDATKLSIIAVKPLLVDTAIPANGTKFYYIDQSGLREGTIASPSTNTGMTFCKTVDSEHSISRWSWSVPTAYAP